MEVLGTIEPKIGFKFTANEKNYVIEDRLSIMRAIEASKLEFELFELSTSTIKKELIGAYNDLNGSNKEKTVKFADAAIKIHNLVNKIDKNLNFKNVPVLRYCALYINQVGEDRRTIDSERIETKINDWQEAGLDMTGFFLLVLSVLPGVKKDFSKFMDVILEGKKEKKAGPNTSTSKK